MGAADFPAGAGPAGIDPPAAPSAPSTTRPPQALLFDGALRDVPLDATGGYAEADPVDHRVALALFVALGSVPAATEIGNTLGDVRIDDPDPLQRDVENRVRRALQNELDAQNIELLTIVATVTVRWRLSVRVDYRNLRLPDAPLRKLTVPS